MPSKKKSASTAAEVEREASQQQQQQQQEQVFDGTTSRIAGRARPKYPPITFILYPLYRLLVSSIAMVMIHHFVITPFLAPLMFNIFRGPASPVAHFFASNKFAQQLLSSSSWLGTKLQNRGQDVGDLLLWAGASSIIHLVTYLVVNGVLLFFERYSTALDAYKIPLPDHLRRAGYFGASKELIKKTLIEATVLCFVSGPLFLALLFLLFSKHKHVATADDLTNWDVPLHRQVLHYFAAWLCNDILFYIVHRAVHEIPGAYDKIHKKHHLHRAPNFGGISAEYASPLEGALANTIPTMIYSLVGPGVPISFTYSWIILRLIETLEAHSVFDFRGTLPYHLGLLFGSGPFHRHHHTVNSGSFGSPLTDWIGGTMDAYLANPGQCAPAQVGGPYDTNKE